MDIAPSVVSLVSPVVVSAIGVAKGMSPINSFPRASYATTDSCAVCTVPIVSCTGSSDSCALAGVPPNATGMATAPLAPASTSTAPVSSVAPLASVSAIETSSYSGGALAVTVQPDGAQAACVTIGGTTPFCAVAVRTAPATGAENVAFSVMPNVSATLFSESSGVTAVPAGATKIPCEQPASANERTIEANGPLRTQNERESVRAVGAARSGTVANGVSAEA